MALNPSILNTIKIMLGFTEDYTPFDTEIMVHINSALMHLEQLGVGPTPPLNIEDAKATWDDLLLGSTELASVKDYIYLKVRTVFDPPAASNVLTAFGERIKELEWRLAVQVENGKTPVNVAPNDQQDTDLVPDPLDDGLFVVTPTTTGGSTTV